ncbi:MAG: threonine/serine dehydratase, partial [Dongiaceae bacterium]
PENIHPAKRRMMEEWGGDVIIHGKIFHYALKHALKTAKAKNIPFVHTFASPDVITGQGTLGIEIMQQLPDADILVIAIGGGGLIGGISVAAKAINKNIKIIGVEPAGAPTLYKALQAGKPVRLASINTKAGTLAMSQTYKINYDLVEKYVDDIVLVSDKEMQTAAKWLWFEYGIAAELAGAASIAALMQNRIKAKPSAKICALVCGAGVDGIN